MFYLLDLHNSDKSGKFLIWLFKQIHPQPIGSLPENIFTDDRVLLH